MEIRRGIFPGRVEESAAASIVRGSVTDTIRVYRIGILFAVRFLLFEIDNPICALSHTRWRPLPTLRDPPGSARCPRALNRGRPGPPFGASSGERKSRAPAAHTATR